MKCRYYYLVLFFFAVLVALSCGNRKTNVREDKTRISSPKKMQVPGIVFLAEMHNFGTLKAGEIVSFSFIFTNNGTMPFEVKKAEPSCGCLSVKYDNKSIAPGEKSVIEVILNTSGEWGNLLRMVEIETSVEEKKELKIGAYIENEQFNNLLNTQK